MTTSKAFSLVEVLIAIAIVAMLSLSLILAFAIDNYTANMSRHRYMVMNFMRGEMENVLASNYSSIAPVSQTVSLNDGSRTISVDETIKIQDISGYKKIYAKFTWTDRAITDKVLKEESIMYVTEK